MHQRDYASFLYNHNRESEGRKFFEEAVSASLTDTDTDHRYLADTYLVWANLERNFGSDGEFSRLITQAKSASGQIRHKGKNKEMNKLITQAESTISAK